MRSDIRADLRLAVVGAAFAACAALPSAAYAFADAAQFFQTQPNAATFGATSEGLYFTGAPRFASLDCSTCHGGGPQRVGLRFNADDPDLFATGYVPGKLYQLQIVLTNETEGLTHNTPNKQCTDPPAPDETFPYIQCNNNGFGLEIDAASGPQTGFCPQNPKSGVCPPPDFTADSTVVPLMPSAPDAIFGARIHNTSDPNNPKLIVNNGATSWTFFWTAPKAGTGPLTVYVAAVDGNGGAGTVANDQDPYNDDTVSANFFLQESGAPVHNSASAGCSAGGGVRPRALAWLLVPILLLAFRRRGGTRV